MNLEGPYASPLSGASQGGQADMADMADWRFA